MRLGVEAEVRELSAALALAAAPGVGPLRGRWLLEATGSPGAALRAARKGHAPALLAEAARARGRPVRPLRSEEEAALRRLRPVPRERLEALQGRGLRVVHYGGPGYPERLRHLTDPPTVLYLQGPLEPPPGRAVAVVGTRRATEYGRRMARRLATELAGFGWTVVSGLARGVDAAAHRGAVDADGPTVGVLGCGHDHVYPRSSARLYARLRRHGLLVSEFPPEEGPRAGHFPRRNRVVAGLADAVVVVQAGRRSGTTSTVDHAHDLGLEVLAVPGPVGPEASVGVHRLLRQGAGLVTSAADVLEALGALPSGGDASGTDGDARGWRPRAGTPEARMWARLRGGPATADELVLASELAPSEAVALLTRLELAGRLRPLAGRRFERRLR